MALPDTVRKRIEAEAAKRGANPAAAVAEAERLSSKTKGATSSPTAPDAPTKPIADRLLIGFLPFITVRELRSEFLGLQDRITDDEMTCGEFQLKHGGAGQSAVADPTAAQ